jgi:hypothetical protein
LSAVAGADRDETARPWRSLAGAVFRRQARELDRDHESIAGTYLDRAIRVEEIEALITIWRFDGATGRAAMADRTMREAYKRFCELHSDRELRRAVRKRTARQWLQGARYFAKAGSRREAMRYVMRAACWVT